MEANKHDDKELSEEKKGQLIKAIEKLNVHLDKRQIEDYLELLQNPKKLIWTNFLAGLSRGIGFTLGIGSLGVLAGVIITALLSLLGYLPIVGELFKSLNKDLHAFLANYVQHHKNM